MSFNQKYHFVYEKLNLPLIIMVSPRNSWSSSIFSCDNETTELSSETESSTTNRLGLFFSCKMAVDRSFSLKFKLYSLSRKIDRILTEHIDKTCSLESTLKLSSLCPIQILSIFWVICPIIFSYPDILCFWLVIELCWFFCWRNKCAQKQNLKNEQARLEKQKWV